jgi:hypothetical protein
MDKPLTKGVINHMLRGDETEGTNIYFPYLFIKIYRLY